MTENMLEQRLSRLLSGVSLQAFEKRLTDCQDASVGVQIEGDLTKSPLPNVTSTSVVWVPVSLQAGGAKPSTWHRLSILWRIGRHAWSY